MLNEFVKGRITSGHLNFGRIISVEKSRCGTYHMVLRVYGKWGFMDWLAGAKYDRVGYIS